MLCARPAVRRVSVAGELLPGPHEDHRMPTDGRGDVHRREARLPHLQAEVGRAVRLYEGGRQSAELRADDGRAAADVKVGVG